MSSGESESSSSVEGTAVTILGTTIFPRASRRGGAEVAPVASDDDVATVLLCMTSGPEASWRGGTKVTRPDVRVDGCPSEPLLCEFGIGDRAKGSPTGLETPIGVFGGGPGDDVPGLWLEEDLTEGIGE
jgi:hypothetical protein